MYHYGKLYNNQKWIRQRIKEGWVIILNRYSHVNCLRASCKDFNVIYKTKENAYRLLTAKEMMRFSGFEYTDYEKIKNIISESQICKQCGNSIVVNVLEAIFKQLFLFDNNKKWLF